MPAQNIREGGMNLLREITTIFSLFVYSAQDGKANVLFYRDAEIFLAKWRDVDGLRSIILQLIASSYIETN